MPVFDLGSVKKAITISSTFSVTVNLAVDKQLL